MDRDAVAVVRRFNRTVTQRVGALRSDYLARDRSLGASRVLWEIGDGRTRRPRRCGRGSTWTPATSAGCCGRWSATGWSTVEPERRRRARPHRAAHAGRARRAGGCSTGAATTSPGSLLEPLERRRSATRLVAAMARGRAAAHGRRSSTSRVERPGRPGRAALPATRTSPSSTGGSTPASTRPRASRADADELTPARRRCSWSRRSTASRSAAAR